MSNLPSEDLLGNNIYHPMTTTTASQIAALINTQNQLSAVYDATKVIKHAERYIYELDDHSNIVGVVEMIPVQWYQCEICHLSVRIKRMGIGSRLLENALALSMSLGARVAQCTIRDGNIESSGLFIKNGFVATVSFQNSQSGNQVSVYQKSLIP